MIPDLGAPWWAPWRKVLAALPPAGDVAAALNALATENVPRFVGADALPRGEAYESWIHHTGQVPTRNNLHDLLAGAAWHRWPALKRRMNQLQAAEIARGGTGARRGARRDALTLFDENGALWTDAPAPLGAALAAHDWQALFVTHRQLWAESRFEIVGHALMEQLATAPRPGLVAHVLLVDPLTLTPGDWARKPFHPLPVLGIPGWRPANEDPSFYADKRVFRPPRPLKAAVRP